MKLRTITRNLLVALAGIAFSVPAAAAQRCSLIESIFNDCGYRIWISSEPNGLPIYNGKSSTGFKTEVWYATDPERLRSIQLRSGNGWIPLGLCSKTSSTEGLRFACQAKK
jgi:hypothetical protein